MSERYYEYGFYNGDGSPESKVVCGRCSDEVDASAKASALAFRLVPYEHLYISDTTWYSLVIDGETAFTQDHINHNHRLSPTEHALFSLLDNIDSLADAIKPSDEQGYREFYLRAMRFAEMRRNFVTCSGDVPTRRLVPTRQLRPPKFVSLLDAPAGIGENHEESTKARSKDKADLAILQEAISIIEREAHRLTRSLVEQRDQAMKERDRSFRDHCVDREGWRVQVSDLQEELKKAQAAIDDLRAQRELFRRQLESLNRNRTVSEAAVAYGTREDKLCSKIASMLEEHRNEVYMLHGKQLDKDTEINSLRSERDKLKADLETVKADHKDDVDTLERIRLERDRLQSQLQAMK